ncbi:MAG: ABC transporter permease [Acidobacteriota bacterium]
MRSAAVRAIAVNSFREMIRDKILYLLLFFGLLLIVVSRVISWLTVGAEIKIIIDVGLAAISVFGVLLATFIGISIVHKEIERKTVYTIVSKPIHRYEFIAGKFLGLAWTLLLVLALMSAMLQVAIYLKTGHGNYPVLRACFLIYFEMLIVVAIAILFSSFSTPILSFLLTLGFYLVGHLSYGLIDLAAKVTSRTSQATLWILYYLLPNLENFNLKAAAVHGLPVPSGFVLTAVAYSFVYASILLLLSIVIFRKRDFQ